MRPLDELEQVIQQRADELARDPCAGDQSYTCKLLAASDEKVGGKIIEEAAEVVEAAAEVGDAGRQHLIYELGDLTYHMLVLMRKHEIALGEVEQELARRFGVSGLTEKASRHSSDSPGT